MTRPKDVFLVDRRQRLIEQIEAEFSRLAKVEDESVNVINITLQETDAYLFPETIRSVCKMYEAEGWAVVDFRRGADTSVIFSFIA